ncbi:hypothetical protein [Actinoplanes sp. GCM10030250]|uniref:hypothetical protein n=1 Tax=Actinoplanes sp. GCM10030250 TaxID=3273376 RepID=UPI003608C323
MDLTRAMLAATDNPPPTSIDIDRLMTGERRRTHRLYAVAGAALAAVLAGGIVVAQQPARHDEAPGAAPPPAVASEEPPSCGISTQTDDGLLTGNPPLRPVTESCLVGAGRLGDALTTVLTGQLPDTTITPPLPAEIAKLVAGDGYFTAFRVAGGDLEVRVRGSETTAAGFDAWRASRCLQVTCRVEQHDGQPVLIRTSTGTVEVIALHADGTMVSALARGGLTEQQLVSIAVAPALTVYP